jgi:WD40 repeat protein
VAPEAYPQMPKERTNRIGEQWKSGLRSGKGGVEVWNIDSLPDHGRGKKKIGKGEISIEDSSRDESDEIERSTGSKPDSTLKFTDSSLDPACWHPFPAQSSSRMLCAPREVQSCLSIDIQAGGQTSARFLGHGGQINNFSTSEADPNAFLTSCNDGLVRLFDVRDPLPCLSFDAGGQSEFIQITCSCSGSSK